MIQGVWTFVLIRFEAQKAHDKLAKSCGDDWHKIFLKNKVFMQNSNQIFDHEIQKIDLTFIDLIFSL